MATPRHETDHVDELIEQWARQRPDLDLDPMATFGRLGRLSAHATRAIAEVFASYDLGIGEFDVLATLRRSGEPYVLKPSDLARVLMLSPAGMTNRLDRLEEAGHIVRRRDPADRRSSLVVLTDAGLDVVDRAVTRHVDNEAHLLAPLTARERSTLDGILRKLLAQFEPEVADPSSTDR